VPAYLRELYRKTFEEYTLANKKLPREVLKSITALENLQGWWILFLPIIQLKTEEKQEILELVSLPHRLR
jgi:ATP-dependent Lon protease